MTKDQRLNYFMALSTLADQEIANLPTEVLSEIMPGTHHIRVRPLSLSTWYYYR
jgi:hypothetical protein